MQRWRPCWCLNGFVFVIKWSTKILIKILFHLAWRGNEWMDSYLPSVNDISRDQLISWLVCEIGRQFLFLETWTLFSVRPADTAISIRKKNSHRLIGQIIPLTRICCFQVTATEIIHVSWEFVIAMYICRNLQYIYTLT